MPIAIQAGMTPEQFWYDDLSLFPAYVIAYKRRVEFEAWKTGYYSQIGFSVALANAFGGKAKYPKYEDPVKQIVKEQDRITKQNLEEKFRASQMEQTMYLRYLIKGMK